VKVIINGCWKAGKDLRRRVGAHASALPQRGNGAKGGTPKGRWREASLPS